MPSTRRWRTPPPWRPRPAGRLGPVCSLTDDTQPSLFPQAYGADSAAMAKQSTPVPVEPGTQVQTDQVTMVYALERR